MTSCKLLQKGPPHRTLFTEVPLFAQDVGFQHRVVLQDLYGLLDVSNHFLPPALAEVVVLGGLREEVCSVYISSSVQL